MHTAQWKLADILRRHRKSALALAKASSLTKTTVYNILHNKSKAVELDTLGKLLAGLEALTGERMSFDDLLERQASSASIDALFQGAKPLHWANLDPLIPDWSEAERKRNIKAQQTLEAAKVASRQREVERTRQLQEAFKSKHSQ
jgi:DNA-binding Xre family transcriptional regulator